MDGVLIIDKPAGMTSHDVVDRIRRACGGRRARVKVGHAGTLDPDATGVLVLAVGRATRLLPYLQAATKTYEARMRLGVTTTTLDASGEVVDERDASGVDEQRLCEVLKGFVGDIRQVPPMVSAVKVDGERLYAKARRGEVVDRAPRPVTVHHLVVEEFTPGPPPEASFLVTCSAGTYVRSLAADAGERLGCGAHLVDLRRLASGRFTLEHAVDLSVVEDAARDGRLAPLLIDMAEAVAEYPTLTVDDGAREAVGHGRALPPSGKDGPVAVLDRRGRLIAMVEDRDGRARPLAVFAPSGAKDG